VLASHKSQMMTMLLLLSDDYDRACLFNVYFVSVGHSDKGFAPRCINSITNCLESIDINESNILAAI